MTIRRVVHVVPALFSSNGGVVGGAERYALELARHMAQRVPTRLVSFGDEAREERVDDLRVRVIGDPWYVRGLRFNPVSWRLFGELRGADVVHCHQHHVLASSLSAISGRLTGKKVFVTDLGGGGWDLSAYLSTDRWYTGHLHISEYSREIAGHAGKPWAHVISGGVDTGKFSPDPALPRDGGVLFVGRIMPHKGIRYLVAATDPETPLLVIGRPYAPEFFEELRALAAGKPVTFRHDCDDAAVVEAYRRALCLVLPSVYRTSGGHETLVPELLGQTLLEGMACETPVICTAVASMPEIVEDGVSGFVVPPNDPAALADRIRWLREHPAEAREMGRAGRRRILERFTWPAVVERCLRYYSGESEDARPHAFP